MTRKRYLSQGFCKDPRIKKLPINGRYLFMGLFSNASDYGKLRDDVEDLRAEIFPQTEITSAEIEELLTQQEALGLILRYSIFGEGYIFIVNFGKYNPLHNPAKDEYPQAPKEVIKKLKKDDVNHTEMLGKVSPTHACLNYFIDKYKAFIGPAYLVNYGRDCAILKSIISIYGEKTTKKLIDIFFESGEDEKEWHSDKISVPIFKACITSMIGKLRQKEDGEVGNG